METMEGLYLEVGPDGNITKNLVTEIGEVKLEPGKVADEVIEYSELIFQYYAVILEVIAYWSEQAQGSDAPEDLGKVDMEAFEELVAVAYDLAAGLSEDNPLYGALTKTLLDDIIGNDDGTARYVYETKIAIEHGLAEIMLFQFRVNDVLDDMRQGIALDFENKYPDLWQIGAVQIITPEDKAREQYQFRNLVGYYKFLLAQFIQAKPNVARCECCGRYFIPKTKKTTLYCDRIVLDGKTCKDVAPALKHKQVAGSDKVVEEFDRAKRRMYKRAERAELLDKKESEKDITFSQYYNWLDAATAARDAYLHGKLSEEDALKVILAE